MSKNYIVLDIEVSRNWMESFVDSIKTGDDATFNMRWPSTAIHQVPKNCYYFEHGLPGAEKCKKGFANGSHLSCFGYLLRTKLWPNEGLIYND